MFPLNYHPETPQRIAEQLRPCTPTDIQIYLNLCLEIFASQPAHNILEFPYDFMVNPYAVFYRWLQQAKFQLTPALSASEIKSLRHFAKFSVKDFRQRKLSSYAIAHTDPPEITNPYFRNFSQIYAVHQLFNSLHVYNFLLENYIHETHRLRTALRADAQGLAQNYPRSWHHAVTRHCPAASEYNFWVRDFLLYEGTSEGQALFTQYMHHNFRYDFQGHHPVLYPAHRTNALDAFLENQKLAREFKRYRYYRWLQPTSAETKFFQGLRNDHGDLTHQELLGAGPKKLHQAVQLAGRLSQRIPYLARNRTTNY